MDPGTGPQRLRTPSLSLSLLLLLLLGFLLLIKPRLLTGNNNPDFRTVSDFKLSQNYLLLLLLSSKIPKIDRYSDTWRIEMKYAFPGTQRLRTLLLLNLFLHDLRQFGKRQ